MGTPFIYNNINSSRQIYVMRGVSAHIPPHFHTYFEMTYVLEGHADHLVNGERYTLDAGDFFIIDRGTWHSFDAEAQPFPIINILFGPGIFDMSLNRNVNINTVLKSNYFMSNQFSSGLPDGYRQYRDRDGLIKSYFTDAHTEFKRGYPGFEDVIKSDIVHILACMIRENLPALPKNTTSHFVRKCVDCIMENYQSDIKLSDICGRLGYSDAYVSRAFRQQTGKSFSEYLQTVRINQACTLLRETDHSAEHIANAVGYRNTTFFTGFSGNRPE